MIAVMWQFDVKAGREADFEELFGANGEWAALSRQARSYLGTSFLRDQNRPSRYMVIEYWSELVVSERHRVFRAGALEALEHRRDALIDTMEPLGIFTALNVPERDGPTWSSRSTTTSTPRKRTR